ncbi:MAG: HI0074 family nucleotidyltransferase substrate-binding subunit [Saprospiraceae bacterium]|nr:HI0074 family nucleotidyltransferase substrate-binding subunit [Saprospiraceae bacterium]
MDKPASRWLQRFQRFEKAFLRLKEAIDIEHLNELERNGLIQRFEFTMDLSWKVMKDFLEYKGFAFKPSPKDTIRLAQQSGYIQYAQALIDGLDLRNELSHDYSEQKFLDAEAAIRKEIYPFLEKIYYFYLSEKQHDSNG